MNRLLDLENSRARRARRGGRVLVVLALAAVSAAGVTNPAAAQTVTSSDGKLTLSGDMATDMIAVHNKYRRLVGSPDIKWDADLAAEAWEYADYMAHSKKYGHDNAPESLYFQQGSGTITYAQTLGRRLNGNLGLGVYDFSVPNADDQVTLTGQAGLRYSF